MKLKHLAISALMLSFVFLVSHATTAQEYEGPKSAVKLGYVTVNGGGRTVTSAGGNTYSDKYSGGLSIGYEYYLASTPKSEIVLGLQWAGFEEEVTGLTGNLAGQSQSVSVSRWHIPVTYKMKFSQSESGGGAYLGAGISFLMARLGNEELSVVDNFGNSTTITESRTAFGFHVKAGFDFNKKLGIDAEWSSGKKDSMELGGLGIFGAYKF